MKILIVKRVTILFFLILIYLSFEVAACRVRVRESFDEGWQFHKGDIVIKRAVKAGRHGGLADADVRMVEGEEIIIAYTDGNKVVDYKASDWTSVNLPHDWLVEEPFVNDSTLGSQSSSNCYRPVGIGFYHKEFNIPIEDEGKRISVEFDGIFRNSTVWGNGHIMGNHPRGYLFTRNIVMALYQPISVTHWGEMVDYNIFTDPSTLKQLHQNETNKHSVYIPVIFLNLEKSNYKVRR